MLKCIKNCMFNEFSINVLTLTVMNVSLLKYKEKDIDTLVSSAYVFSSILSLVSELKEQLLARSSRVDDIECLKAEFNKQKRGIKEQNEAELENLRRFLCFFFLTPLFVIIFILLTPLLKHMLALHPLEGTLRSGYRQQKRVTERNLLFSS